MAIGATRNNAGMVHGRPGKRAGALMAGLAGRRGLDMGAWLTFGSAAVMAVGAA